MSDSVPQVVGSYCITSTVMKCCHHHGKFYWTVEFSVLFDRSWWWQIPRDRVGSRVLCSSHWPCLEHRSNEEMAWKVYLFFRVFAEDPQRNTLCTPYYTEGRTQGLSTGVLDLGSLGLNVLLLTPLSLHFLIRKIRVILMSPSSQCWGIDVVLLQSHLAGSWNTLSAPMCQLLVLISYSFVIYLRSAIHVSRIRPHILKKICSDLLSPTHCILCPALCSLQSPRTLYFSSYFIAQSFLSPQKTMNILKTGSVPCLWICRASVLSTAGFQCLWAPHGRLQNVSIQL